MSAVRNLFLSTIAVLGCISGSADVRLPKLFSDHMVLQRDRPIAIWGWAGKGEKITVQLHGQEKKITADKNGNWRIDLGAEAAGGPYTLTVSGKNKLMVNDVLIGEVWLCSGQSNMEMPLGAWGFVDNYKEEIAAADYPQIRQFEVPKKIATQPQQDVGGEGWTLCDPENAAKFSAVAYFYARALYKQLHVPVGVINSSWGGTIVETWTSREAFEQSDEFTGMISTMPKVDLNALQEQHRTEGEVRLKELQGALPTATEADQWKNADFNDANWNACSVPGFIESQGPGNIDGVFWLRKTITLTTADVAKQATLQLAMIDDNDETYINGIKIGATIGYNQPRNYEVPAGVLKEGKNVIAVRVTDTGGGGGIYGDASDCALVAGGRRIGLAGKWLYRIESLSQGQANIGPNSYPTLLFNAMINPLVPYAIKGAIWYQGESNVSRAFQYRKAFPMLIADWRKQWKQGDFPFYFVQLASFNAKNGTSATGSEWAELREAQSLSLSLPNTGMAVTTDIGDAKDIHPKNKQEVGKRLAAIALNKTYSINTPFSGPVLQSFSIRGKEATIVFTNTSTGLVAKDKYGYIKGFELAGADRKFHYARASIINPATIVVTCDSVPDPVALRFGWADFAGDDNLYNSDGFPAGPFRTDTWKGVTDDIKYEIGQ